MIRSLLPGAIVVLCASPAVTSIRKRLPLFGALFFGYGMLQGSGAGCLMLTGLQAADEDTPVLVPFLLALAIPALLVLIGLGLMRLHKRAYRAALLLPLLIVPLGVWWILNPRGRPGVLWASLFGPLGGGAFFALGSILASLVLLWLAWGVPSTTERS